MVQLTIQAGEVVGLEDDTNLTLKSPSDEEDPDAMTLEPGVHTMTNCRSETMLDLSGGDNKSIIGFPCHGLQNQQWEFAHLGDGWSIRSVHTGTYLTVERGIGNGVPVVANGYPVAWAIEHAPSGDDSSVFRIFWPNTRFNFDLDAGSPTPGAKIHLWSSCPTASHQTWRLERCPDREVATTSTQATATTTTTTVTTTTVTTTVSSG